jgi:hypothetical protein
MFDCVDQLIGTGCFFGFSLVWCMGELLFCLVHEWSFWRLALAGWI